MQMTSQWGVDGQIIMLILAPMCFSWNNLWSVCLYITELWLLEAGWEGIAISNRPYLNMYVRYLWSPVHISHGLAFKLHILHKSDNIPHWVIVYRCTKPDSVQFMRNWEKYATSFEAGFKAEPWVINYVPRETVKINCMCMLLSGRNSITWRARGDCRR